MRIFFIVLMFLWTQLAQSQFSKLYDFVSDNDLKYPKGEAVYDGTWLYGLTTGGGSKSLGCVFKIKPDGSGLTKLIDFTGTNGSNPYGSLTLSGSTLYGMTSDGGTNNLGVIFKINTDGTGFTKLLDFSGSSNGAFPLGTLLVSGTTIYGMTFYGGINNYGVVFRINTDGTGYNKLFDFDGYNTGANPARGFVISGSTLYGMTNSGGTYSDGIVFRLNTDGTGYLKLYDFSGTDGANPWSSLNLSGSTLFGTTIFGGLYNKGVLFKINTDGSGFTKYIDFDGVNHGSYPYQSLTLSGTILYGMAYNGGINDKGAIFRINTNGTGFTRLLDFSGLNGAYPISPLTLAGSVLYGMSAQGGTSERGTVFRINTDGTGYFKILNCKNAPLGIFPQNNKMVSDGTWLYATTTTGSTGYGVTYKVRLDGTGYTVLFDSDGNNYGSRPSGFVLSGSTLYGETNSGGTNNFGLIFKINTDGSGYTKMLDFNGASNGANPNPMVLSGSTLYGCTTNGGFNNQGVLFKINTDGTGYNKLIDFDSINRGKSPNSSLILVGSTLYGTTLYGGVNDRGVIFKINTDGTGYSKMVDFDGTNGSMPYGELAQYGSSLYGMTYNGGTNGKGVVFKINTDGTNYTKLLEFDGANNGANPYGSMTIIGSTLFGMTYKGGTNDSGVLFKINSDGSGYTKLLDFDGTANGKYALGTLYAFNCSLYGVTYEGGNYDGGTLFKYDLKPSDAGPISGTASVCEGQSGVTYTVPAITNATSYIWTLPSGATGSSITNSISVTFGAGSVSGNIIVKGTNSYCEGTVSTFAVNVNHKPVAAASITGTAIVVQGQTSVSYSVPAITYATSYVWNYSGSGATINGTGNSVTVSFSGSATSGNLTVYGSSSCGNGLISSTYPIIVNVSPPIVGTLTQPTCILQTGSVILNGLPATGTWTLTRTPGGIINSGSGTSSTITGLSPGTYNFTVTNASGNTSASSSNIIILTPKTGVIPKIKAKWNNDVLICYNLLDSIFSWQWYKGSSAISGANKQYYFANRKTGEYWVMTTDKAGCINFSNIISISGTKSISVYPNPASVTFALKINGESEGKAIVTVMNSSGMKVLEFQIESTTDELLNEIPVNNLNMGIYLVKVVLDNNDLFFTKIMVLK
jgi:uncharacterized repeat protein (TIGR03803 family)